MINQSINLFAADVIVSVINWFSNIGISQGSVATRLRYEVGYLMIAFALLQISLILWRSKNFENRPVFG